MFRPASTVSPLRTLHCFAGTPPTPLDRPPYDTAFGDGNFGYAIESAFGQSAGWDAVACDGDAAVTVGPFQTQEGAALGPIRRWNGRGQPDRPFGHSGDRLEAFGFAEARASRAVIDRASRHLFVAGHSWKSYPSEIGLTRIDARTGSTDTGFGRNGVVQIAVRNGRVVPRTLLRVRNPVERLDHGGGTGCHGPPPGHRRIGLLPGAGMDRGASVDAARVRDTSFAELGTARFDLHRHRHWIGSRSVTTDATGRILIAGFLRNLPQSENEGLLPRALAR